MSLPVIEQIAVAIKTRLEQISTDEDDLVTVTSVIRPKRTGTPTPTDHNIVLQQGFREEPEEQASDHSTWIQQFLMDLVIRPDDNDVNASDTLTNAFVAAVEDALIGDDTWHPLGLIDKHLAGPTALPEGAAYDGVRLTLAVTYRTAAGDPLTGG